MSFLEFTEEVFPAGSSVAQVDKQQIHCGRRNYRAAVAWAVGTLLAAGVLLYIAAPKNTSQPRQLPLTAASQTESPQVIAKNVEDIQAGDVVVSYDEATGEQVFNRVVETYERTSYHLRFIETRSLESAEVQTFETTDEHPFWKVDIGWIDAGKLQPGDQLLQHNGQFAEVISTRYEAHPEGVTVYNFQVANAHSYYVSASSTRGPPILVHNANYGLGNAPRVVDAWALRHTGITARLKEHLSHAVKQAKLTPAQARDVMKNGRASTHWGTQIDTRFKELVQNDPLLRGDVAVSPRSLPEGSGAADVIDLRSKRWWDVTSTAKEFAKKPAKYGTQFGDGTSLLYGEP